MADTFEEVVRGYLADAAATFRAYKRLAERALVQVDDEEFFRAGAPESNSIALIVKHIAGNQRSRWTNFLTEDGEKPDRNRDSEFEEEGDDRAAMMRNWEEGWAILLGTIDSLSAEDLKRSVTIRGEAHTVVQAINRQLTHYAYHTGQIVLLAKEIRGDEWRSLSVPRNRSREFNEFLAKKAKDGGEASHPIEGPAEFAEAAEEDR
ncbi:MAG: DUF1572 family protein [Acidobacteriota bacterium]|nr:MAG: DUF1572 family protein [Acidobacteriota bacterium]